VEEAEEEVGLSSGGVMFHGGRPLSLRGSLKALEADIHHANALYVILSSLLIYPVFDTLLILGVLLCCLIFQEKM